MFNISEYLHKFKKISESRDFLRVCVSESIKNICGVEVEINKINIKNGVARINTKPIIKTEIFLKKTKIIEDLRKKTQEINDLL